jgi:hypothetical protein
MDTARRNSSSTTTVLLSEFNRKHEEKLLVVRKLKYRTKFCCCQFLSLVNLTQLWRDGDMYSRATWCMCYIELCIVLSDIFTELNWFIWDQMTPFQLQRCHVVRSIHVLMFREFYKLKRLKIWKVLSLFPVTCLVPDLVSKVTTKVGTREQWHFGIWALGTTKHDGYSKRKLIVNNHNCLLKVFIWLN